MSQHNEKTEEINSEKKSKRFDFTKGLKSGVPIAIGYIPIAITFGVIAKSYGVSNIVTGLMSFLIFAGASQFIGVNLIAMGATTMEIVLTTFILNFRHFLMSSSLSQRIEGKPSSRFLSLLAFGITDETFAVASLSKEEKLHPKVILGLNTIAYLSWSFGTLAGLIIGDALPNTLKSSMGISLYVMFIGLLVPSIKKNRPLLFVTAISIAVSCLLYWVPIFSFVSNGWRIIISTLAAAGIGACIYKKEGT